MRVPSDLRATSDALLRDLEARTVLEDELRTHPLDDPRPVEIAEQVESIEGRVLSEGERQTLLARAAARTEVLASQLRHEYRAAFGQRVP